MMFLSVLNILGALNVYERQVPHYGMAVMLEFSQHKESKEYGVEVN